MSEHVPDPFEGADEQESKLHMEDFLDAYQLASKGQRFGNYIVDYIVTSGITWMVLIPMMFTSSDFTDPYGEPSGAGTALSYLVSFSLMIAYYAVMEKVTGKTLGKMVTGTRVVREDGSEISWGQAWGRSLARLIPFEPFSVLFSGDAVGWHDSMPNTRVIKAR